MLQLKALGIFLVLSSLLKFTTDKLFEFGWNIKVTKMLLELKKLNYYSVYFVLASIFKTMSYKNFFF